MKIEITGLTELRRELKDFSDRRFNATVATALTRTAVKVRAEAQAELQRSIDKPTPFTVRQLRYVPATAERPVAAVGFNVAAIQDIRGNVVRYEKLATNDTPAGRYLSVQQSGGSRRTKRLEEALRAVGALPGGWFIVPGQGAKLDGYGNVSRGQVIQVLSQLKVQTVAGTNRNMSQRSAIAAQRKAGGRFFVIPPGKAKVQPGIYQREFIGRNVAPVFIFVRSVSYAPRFDFDRVVTRVRDAELPAQLRRSISEQLKRLAAR